MKIVHLIMGNIESNCYIVTDEEKKEAVIIDPGFYSEELESKIDELIKNNIKLKYILLTHGHFDHIAGAKDVQNKTGARICVHKDDANMLTTASLNLSTSFLEMPVEIGKADMLLDEDKILFFGDTQIKIISTAGHSMGSCCYVINDCIFTGDTLFASSIGRTDFPGSDEMRMVQSLKKLKNITGDYKIYPGHGPSTSLSIEKLHNPYLNR